MPGFWIPLMVGLQAPDNEKSAPCGYSVGSSNDTPGHVHCRGQCLHSTTAIKVREAGLVAGGEWWIEGNLNLMPLLQM